MIEYVSKKLKISKKKVAETIIREGEKEDDGMIGFNLLLKMLEYFEVWLNSIEQNALIKELGEEGILIKLKGDDRMKPWILLKLLGVPLPEEEAKGAPI